MASSTSSPARDGVLAVVLVAAVTTLAGCGGGNSAQQAQDAVEGLQRSYASARWKEACDYLTPAARKHLGEAGHDGPLTCVEDLRQFSLDALPPGANVTDRSPLEPPTVSEVVVNGNRAVATLLGSAGTFNHLPLARVEGEWKVDALYGSIPASRQEDKF